jgi:hypothetical protein
MAGACISGAQVTVVTPQDAHPLEKYAAAELISRLSRIYPEERFLEASAAPADGRAIVLARSQERFAESYRISVEGGRATIAGAGARGVLYGVYALLERLGCGFYLSSETLPPPRAGRLAFDGWTIEDRPVFPDRIVFDWHNFLSSASAWEFADWQRYIDNSVRMRFNVLMIHAYGNNPMFTFRFAGLEKPVGYLATTAAGRDWGTQHVNDVRRLIGGDLFSRPVFGSSAATAEPGNRVAAATKLMQRVIGHASSRGMGVTFALDVDTASANPQEMIQTLPASARIAAGKFQLANPDAPEGYAFYKAQVEQLFATYPQITRLAIWFRNNNTPWTDIKLSEFPAAWKAEFQGDPAGAPSFAVAKLIRAFQKALRETGRVQVEVAAGSWRLGFLEQADRHFPREVALMPLDWSTVFDTAAGQRALRAVKSGRRLIPIVWAHHDDRTYIGRPYTPYVNFFSLLHSVGGSGFGIIHWTTRPLDLYFKSTVDQTWNSTLNQPLEVACEHMAARLFGEAARERGREYLFSFVTEAPMFGRETSDRFMDIPLAEPALHLKRSEARSVLLASLSSTDTAHLDYFRRYEEFIRAFFRAQMAYETAQAALKAADYGKVREALAAARPEEAIRLYAAAVRSGESNPGEKALVISLNLRWLPYFVSLRQAAGIEPVRYRAGRVEREPLAQGAGNNTFHIDEQGRLWKVIDRAALAGPLRLGAIMGDRLEPGRYSINGGAPVEVRDGLIDISQQEGVEEVLIARVRQAAGRPGRSPKEFRGCMLFSVGRDAAARPFVEVRCRDARSS